MRSDASDFFTRWAQWFLADRLKRTISPSGLLATREYIARKITEASLPSLTEALAWAPADGLLFALLSRELLKQTENPSRIIEAEWCSARGLALSPDNIEVLACRANVLAKAGRTEEAFAALNRVLDLQPGHAWASFLRGKLYFEKEEWQKALDDLNRSLAIDAANPEASQLRQECLSRLSRANF